MPKQWYALESNPEVLNNYLEKLGVDISIFCINDVLSTEEWAIEMVMKPIIAVIFLYPVKTSTDEYMQVEKENIANHGQIVSDNVFYMKQTIGNACGTIALLHAVGNNRRLLSIKEGSFLDRFYRDTESMSAMERALYLESDNTIEDIHSSSASEGQSDQLEGEVDTHFICFSVVDGHLYELDGRKEFPINHGVCSEDNILESASQVIQQFMARDPNELKFTILALSSNAAAYD